MIVDLDKYSRYRAVFRIDGESHSVRCTTEWYTDINLLKDKIDLLEENDHTVNSVNAEGRSPKDGVDTFDIEDLRIPEL